MQARKRKNQIASATCFLKLISPFPLCAVLMLPGMVVAQGERPTFEEAVRFLQQATFGATTGDVALVQASGFERWIDDQTAMLSSGWQDRPLLPADPASCAGDQACVRDGYRMYPVQQEFFIKALTAPDQLRQRMAFALDQIWVISAQLNGNFQAGWMSNYLRILDDGAFGNWRDLMYAITLSPGMGKYLDTAGNRYVASRSANENYAREILQLFCVGVDDLDDYGRPIFDSDGRRIPTYTQEVVIGFSKAFTGWTLSPPDSGSPNWRDPMVHDGNPNNNHDPTEKLLLDGVVLPPRVGQIDEDLNAALDNIFNNHNVPPFISKQLIQKLVTSNPSPQYVFDIAQVFKDDGSAGHVRGNLAAVVKAILLHPEARGVPVDPQFGKLREPVLAITNLLRNFDVDGSPCSSSPTGEPCTDFVLGEAHQPNFRMDQDIFRSPTVFNFFSPEYPISGGDLVGPEFGILSTTTALARINMMNALIYTGIPRDTNPPNYRPYGTRIDPAKLEAYWTGTDDGLISGLSQIMIAGTLPDDVRGVILDRIAGIADPAQKAQQAAYLIATSSSYNIQR
jgi:uncharacterized protein (DUF1800 family)